MQASSTITLNLAGDYTAAMVPEHENEDPQAAEITALESSEQEPSESEDPTAGVPGVDELQTRLASLQGAMDQLQSGDLDGAEATITALEQSMATPQSSTS